MGNGCWTYHHFTPEIQTRQYRSPEVIIGADYDTSADVWSFACTVFEMVTGDFLFEPRKGQVYDKDDDHLAQMMELLGRMPKNMALSGKHSERYFDKSGNLKNIRGLNYWPIQKVLMEKYRIKEQEAVSLAQFLTPMLEWYPQKRANAKDMLNHPWLSQEPNMECKYTDREFEIMTLKKQVKGGDGHGTKADGGAGDDLANQEMSELVESDEELNQAEDELSSDEADEENDMESEKSETSEAKERSFLDEKERDVELKNAKTRQAKINNSFTGPYPLDPVDFNHTDKGPNMQFVNLVD